MRKHLFDEAEQQALFDQFKATTDISTEPVTAAAAGQQNGNGERQRQRARAEIRDGEEPPFDFEATYGCACGRFRAARELTARTSDSLA